MPQHKVTVVICVDADGEYEVGKDEEEARTNYESNIGELSDQNGFQLVQVEVFVSVPGLVTLTGATPVPYEASLNLTAKPATTSSEGQ